MRGCFMLALRLAQFVAVVATVPAGGKRDVELGLRTCFMIPLICEQRKPQGLGSHWT